MAVTPRVVRRLRGGTSALDLDTEGGRAFLQRRVAFFNKVAFCISGAFFVVAAFAGPYYGDPSPPLLHAATLVVSASERFTEPLPAGRLDVRHLKRFTSTCSRTCTAGPGRSGRPGFPKVETPSVSLRTSTAN